MENQGMQAASEADYTEQFVGKGPISPLWLAVGTLRTDKSHESDISFQPQLALTGRSS